MRENKYVQSEKMDNNIKTDDRTRRVKKRGETTRYANSEIWTQAHLIAEEKGSFYQLSCVDECPLNTHTTHK